MLVKGPVYGEAFPGQDITNNRKTLFFKKITAAAFNVRVGISHPDNNLFYACFQNRTRAGRGSACMVTRFESHIDCCASCLFPGISEGVYFRMRGPGASVIPLADNLTIFYHNRADTRVRRGPANSLYSLFQGHFHETAILFQSSFPSSIPFNSSMNSLKSLNCLYTDAKRT